MRLYCKKCQESGKQHQHEPLVEIKAILESISKIFSGGQKIIEVILKHTASKYGDLEPIVSYLEKVSLELSSDELSQYPIKHQINTDINKIKKQRDEWVSLEAYLISQIKNEKVLNVINQQKDVE